MKVLWFSLSPCGSMRRDNNMKLVQGWMISLEDEVKKTKDVELAVCYFSETSSESFTYDGVRYYPILQAKSTNPLSRILDRRKNISERDEALLPKMLDVVKNYSPDLIHIHGTEERFGLISEYIKEIPIVYSIQGLMAPYCEKFFSGFPKHDYLKLESWYDKIRSVSIIDEYKQFVQRGEREISYLKDAKYVIGRTFWDRYITKLLNPYRKYYVVNEIMREQFYKRQWKGYFCKDCIRIISTISPGPYKGFETVLKTAKWLHECAPFKYEWTIVGLEDTSRDVQVACKLTDLNIFKNHVKLVGRKNADELASLLSDSDIYVHVSHIENSPNSICEAKLIGMPIVATFTGGTASILENNEEGILVQDGAPYVTAGAIVELINNSETAKQMACNARDAAMVRHAPQNVANELITTYKDIIQNENIICK